MLLPALTTYIRTLSQRDFALSEDRKGRLRQIAVFITEKLDSGHPANLIFICTHNSRRSHFAQVWAQVLAFHLGLENVRSFSGGTEATAAHPNTLRALQRAGFEVVPLDEGQNPRQRVGYGVDGESFEIWSKRFGDPANPQQDFCAIMTCSEADEACPVVWGAGKRVALPFEDPKIADGTPEESRVYDERCRQIAGEMWYVFSQLKNGSYE